MQDQLVRSTSSWQYGVRVKFVFKYRRHIGAMFVVVFEFKFKFKFESLYRVRIAVGYQPSYLRSVGKLARSLLTGYSSIGVLAWCLSVCIVYRLSLSRRIRYPRRIGTELVVIFEVAGVSAQDLVSSYSSTMLAIGSFLINFVHRSLYSLVIGVVYRGQDPGSNTWQ